MTDLGHLIGSVAAAGVVAAGGLLAGDTVDEGSAARTALVVDAAAGRDGRDLDPRLRETEAQVRLARTPSEARTDLRYFAAQGYRLVVTGPRSSAAARATGTAVQREPDLASALAAARR